MQERSLADAIGKSGKVAIFFSAQEKTESSRRRVEGFKEAISAYSDISVVQELYMDKVEDMQSAIESTLQSYPDLAGVFVPMRMSLIFILIPKKQEIMF